MSIPPCASSDALSTLVNVNGIPIVTTASLLLVGAKSIVSSPGVPAMLAESLEFARTHLARPGVPA